jgi:hypothetical protein
MIMDDEEFLTNCIDCGDEIPDTEICSCDICDLDGVCEDNNYNEEDE